MWFLSNSVGGVADGRRFAAGPRACRGRRQVTDVSALGKLGDSETLQKLTINMYQSKAGGRRLPVVGRERET